MVEKAGVLENADLKKSFATLSDVSTKHYSNNNQRAIEPAVRTFNAYLQEKGLFICSIFLQMARLNVEPVGWLLLLILNFSHLYCEICIAFVL